MAALSSDQAPDELLPALARNVVTNGYRATRGAETLEQTEYMKLVLQYLSQARELAQFAGADQTIDVPACESQETAQLLKIIGFRLRNECGPDSVLETVNPSRAFLSIDSGFPLAELESAFRTGTAGAVAIWIDATAHAVRTGLLARDFSQEGRGRFSRAVPKRSGRGAPVRRVVAAAPAHRAACFASRFPSTA